MGPLKTIVSESLEETQQILALQKDLGKFFQIDNTYYAYRLWQMGWRKNDVYSEL